MVKDGRVTWEQLESFGMALPSLKQKQKLAEKMLDKAFKRLRREE